MSLPDEPITRIEQYLAKTATGDGSIPDAPITRIEQYLAKTATGEGDIPESPITRIEQYLDYIAKNGGGSSVDVEAITITKNGTTTAPSGKAYSPVTVSVPNSYSASDQWKVVNNGALIEQVENAEYSSNGVYDTKDIKSISINVDGWKGSFVIEGTLANPYYGNFDFDFICDRIAGFNQSFVQCFPALAIDMSSIGGTTVVAALYLERENNIPYLRASLFQAESSNVSDALGGDIKFDANGLVFARMLTNGAITDLSPYANLIDTIFIIPEELI